MLFELGRPVPKWAASRLVLRPHAAARFAERFPKSLAASSWDRIKEVVAAGRFITFKDVNEFFTNVVNPKAGERLFIYSREALAIFYLCEAKRRFFIGTVIEAIPKDRYIDMI